MLARVEAEVDAPEREGDGCRAARAAPWYDAAMAKLPYPQRLELARTPTPLAQPGQCVRAQPTAPPARRGLSIKYILPPKLSQPL